MQKSGLATKAKYQNTKPKLVLHISQVKLGNKYNIHKIHMYIAKKGEINFLDTMYTIIQVK